MMIAKITKKRERIMTTKEFIENPNRDANENSAEMTAQYGTTDRELSDEELAAVTGGAADNWAMSIAVGTVL